MREYIKLCDVCDFQGGSQPPKDEWSFDFKAGYIRMLQIRDFTQSERVAPEYIKITKTTRTCEADDILIARYGASLGKILTGLAGAYNVAIMRTIPNTNILEKKYLYFYLKSPVFQGFLLNVGSRAAQAGFNKNDLQDLFIPNITRNEQVEIVGILERVETVIESRQKELQKLDDLIKARFVEMFENDNYPIEKLGEICEKITDGTHKTPTYLEEGITFISAKNIVNGELDFTDIKYISEEAYQEIQKRCQTSLYDILLSKSGSLGYPVIVKTKEKLGLFESLAVLKYDREKILPEFLCEQLKTNRIQRQFYTGTKGVAIKHLHLGVIANTGVIVPPLDSQKTFADFVQQVDKSREAVKKSLEKTKQLYDSLMQEYFG
ncbi:restriction endonuclease subunit S [Holdemanella biformis]